MDMAYRTKMIKKVEVKWYEAVVLYKNVHLGTNMFIGHFCTMGDTSSLSFDIHVIGENLTAKMSKMGLEIYVK